MIDKFRHPEPFTSILMAMNAGLRRALTGNSSIDKVAIIPFAREVIGQVPYQGLTRDLRFMVDLSNGNSVGDRVLSGSTWSTQGVQHPNYIDRNWSPYWGAGPTAVAKKGGTNIIGALNEAIQRLVDPNFCAVDSRKSIIIATDGILSSYYDLSSGVNWSLPKSILTPTDLRAAEDLLYAKYKPSDGVPSNILRQLIENNIRLTSILVGEAVEPNFVNVQKTASPQTFYSLLELPSRGYRGFPDLSTYPPEVAITDNSPTLPTLPSDILYTPPWPCNPGSFNADMCAFKINSFFPGVKFRRPNGYMAQLAALSGGLFCPLMDPYMEDPTTIRSSCYDATTKLWKAGDPACARADGSKQVNATFGAKKGGQAAECVRMTLGRPPYALAIEEDF
jgi:hypothetical protein